MEQVCSCDCGETFITVYAKPLSRFVCHCLNCQGYTNSHASDECAFLLKDIVFYKKHLVEMSGSSSMLSFQKVKCGLCKSPIYSIYNLALGLKLVFVPSKNVSAVMALPHVAAHAFYHRRICNIDDQAPKYSGYWSSQLNTARILVQSCLKRGGV